MANAQKKAEQERKNQVRSTTSQGIRDLQPLYADYRADAAIAAGLQFNQQNLAVANAQSGYDMEMSGYGRTNLAGRPNETKTAFVKTATKGLTDEEKEGGSELDSRFGITGLEKGGLVKNQKLKR